MDGSRDPAIMLRSLRKTYRQVVALDALSLAVAPGSINGLLGPNGSGRQQRSASCPRRCGPTVARHWWPDWTSPPIRPRSGA
jgi:ABC-type phosphonate transport system ATPase subunit